MDTCRKILASIGLASMLAMGVVGGASAPAVQQTVSVAIENIQKPGHVTLAEVYIQKPGH